MVSAKVKGEETGRVKKRQGVRSYLQVVGRMFGLSGVGALYECTTYRHYVQTPIFSIFQDC